TPAALLRAQGLRARSRRGRRGRTMKRASHTVPVRRLARLASGGLREGARRRLASHVVGCASCRAAVDQLGERIDAVRLAPLPEESAAERREHIEAAVDAARAHTARVRSRRWLAWPLVAVTAAALVLLTVLWRRSPVDARIIEGSIECAGGARSAGDDLVAADRQTLEIVKDVEL